MRISLRVARWSFALFLLVFALPIATHAAWQWQQGWPDSWSGADWSSAGLLPDASDEPEAVVYVMAARVGRWRGIFAHHSWLVLKPTRASHYTRYDVVGWGRPVRTNHRDPDGRWYGNEPEVVLILRGEAAARAIPRIEAAVADYALAYRVWPGPNSNTFVAHLAGAEPALAPALLPTALGKDYRGSLFAGLAPSRTGLQLSLAGVAGVTIGWIEGVEVNLFGLVAGVDLRRPALKIPAWGRVGSAPG
jgi:hypothetical protein